MAGENSTESRAMVLGRRASAAPWRWLQILLLSRMSPEQVSEWFSSAEGEAMAERITPTEHDKPAPGELPVWRKRDPSD